MLGKTFTKQALASLTELPDGELEPILSSLARKEVFGVQADPRSPEHGQYGFLQDLLRKVAYETLAKADRKARHLAAAAYLEQALAEQEVVEVVASHYLAAYEAAPDAADAAEIRTKAGEQLARAGERAASLGANEEAERYFAQAAGARGRPAGGGGAARSGPGGAAWLGRGEDRSRERYLEQALGVFEAEGLHAAGGARSRRISPRSTIADGHPPEAVARLEAALETLAGEEPDEDVADAAAQLGRFLVLNQQHELAAPRLELALELAEALRLPEVFAQALTSKSTPLLAAQQARGGAHPARGRARASRSPTTCTPPALRAINNLAVNHESQRPVRRRRCRSPTGASSWRGKVGDRIWEADLPLGPISSLVLLGRWDEALAREAGVAAGQSSAGMGSGVAARDGRVRSGGHRTARASRLDEHIRLKVSDDVQARYGYALRRGARAARRGQAGGGARCGSSRCSPAGSASRS